MNAKTIADAEDRGFATIVAIFMGIAIFIGVLLSVVFWGIFYLLGGSIPKVFGILRLWLDMALGPWVLIVLCYLIYCINQEDELSFYGQRKVAFKEFAIQYPFSVFFGLFLIADLTVSVLWSFTVGLLGIAALAVIIGLGYGILKILEVYSRMPNFEEGDAD